jgi:hypothetical protein
MYEIRFGSSQGVSGLMGRVTCTRGGNGFVLDVLQASCYTHNARVFGSEISERFDMAFIAIRIPFIGDFPFRRIHNCKA